MLIVENRAGLLRHMVDYLGLFPGEFEVRAATAWDEAAGMMRSQRFDVLLADLDVVGAESVAWLQETARISPRTRIIAMTAFATPEIREHVLAEGAAELLEKPFDIGDLRSSLLSPRGNG